jgi:acyl-CoA synthetase (NDP forming)
MGLNEIRYSDPLDYVFYPRSTAIIGATNREGSFGRLFLQGFRAMGYQRIYPIHPREKELLGLTAYPSVKDVPGEVDLAILLTPPELALKLVQECADKGVRAILVFTAGFREKGEEGRRVELEIAEIARRSGTRVIGPNSNGFYCPSARLLTLPGSLTAGGLPVESGALSGFSHSGSFNDYLSQVLVGKNIRLNKIVSCGNEADLGAVDFLEYFGKDDSTRIVAGYLEGIKEGRRFFELARDISHRKPIVIWKGGETESGARAALAHTGKLAGSKQAWEAVFKQAGIVGVHSFQEMIDTLLAFSWLPLPAGRRVAIISGMGGTNVGTADNCLGMGLEIARFSPATAAKLAHILPALGTAAANPVDVGVGMLLAPEIYGEVIHLLSQDENVDMLLAITAPESPRSIQSICQISDGLKKPLAVAVFDIKGLEASQVQILQDKRLPAYHDARRAASALARMADYADFRNSSS